jgi:hypothetical protein
MSYNDYCVNPEDPNELARFITPDVPEKIKFNHAINALIKTSFTEYYVLEDWIKDEDECARKECFYKDLLYHVETPLCFRIGSYPNASITEDAWVNHYAIHLILLKAETTRQS